MNNNELAHHGVKGMKWGVRRSKTQLARAGGKKPRDSSKEIHEDYKKAHSKKSVKTMSDAELRNRLNRLNMEQQYAKLNPTTVSKGKNQVSKVLKVAGGVATASGTALTLYSNANKIRKIIGK